jgi:hypothetical protein
LLQILNNIEFSQYEKIYLYSGDFESLYTNIEREFAIDLILDFAKEKNALDLRHINLEALKLLLEIIFEKNIFQFKSHFYKQRKGFAMGVICGPVCANIVVYMLEKKWLCIHRPIVYRRFIDDVALVSSQLIDLDSFRKVFGSLRLNIEFGNEIHFLDLKIIYDPTYRRISTSLYIKPTNTFSYLSVNSNHKSSIFKNIPFSLLIRVRRSCSEDFDFFFFSRLLVSQLKKRGYCHYFLMNVVRRVSNLNRKTLLPYKKNKSLSNSKNKNFFVMPFNNSNIDINRIIYNSFNSFINLYKLDNFKI